MEILTKYCLQSVFLLYVEPSSLQSFSLGCLYIEECVVDEEALLSRSSYHANCMMIYGWIWLCKMHFVRDKDVVEEVGAGIAFLRKITTFYLFPMQVVGVGEQVCVIAIASQSFYQVKPPLWNQSDASIPNLHDVFFCDTFATMTQHERKELLACHISDLIGRDDFACRNALTDGRCVLCVCFDEEQFGIDAEAFASLSNALHVEVEQHAPKVEDDISYIIQNSKCIIPK